METEKAIIAEARGLMTDAPTVRAVPVRRALSATRIAGGLAVALGLYGAGSFAFGPWPGDGVPGDPAVPAMHPLAAAALALLGIALLGLQPWRTPLRVLVTAAAAVVVALAGFVLLLAAGDAGVAGLAGVGWNTLFTIALLAAALLLRRRGRHGTAQFTALLALAPCLVGLVGLTYGVGPFFGRMAPITIAGGLVLGAGIFAAGVHRSAARVLTGPWAAGRTLRIHLALALAVPFLFGLVMQAPASAPVLTLFVVFVSLGMTVVAAAAAISFEDADANRRRAERALLRLATRDRLTGLANRRAFEAAALAELARSSRSDDTTALVLIDLDRFKEVNDRFGHAAGDRVLALVGACLGSAVRHGDLVARWGGEEFLVLLPRTEPEEAEQVAGRLRSALAGLDVAAHVPELGSVTVSAGVAATRVASGDDVTVVFRDLLARADRALYLAKSSGRNRVAAA